MYTCKHFNIKELVSKTVYTKFGEKAWQFFSKDILQDLDTIREAFGSSIIINNWANGGSFSQCGLRENICQIVKADTASNKLYCSAHTMGKAFDLHAQNGQHKKLYDTVYNLIVNKKLQTIKRLENFKDTGTWVHVDEFQSDTIVF